MKYTGIALWIIVACAWVDYVLLDSDSPLVAIIVTSFAATATLAVWASRSENRKPDE